MTPHATYETITGQTCPKCGCPMARVEFNPTACRFDAGKFPPLHIRPDCRETGEHLHIYCACGYGVTEKCLDHKP